MKKIACAVIFMLAVVLAGCSGNSPTTPVQTPSQDNPQVQILASGTMNLENQTVEFNERSTEGYLNVTSLVGSNFSFTINGIVPPDILDITLRINNVSGLTVHDVCIVFENLYGKTVTNPDSYMDIFGAYDIDPFIAFRKEDPNRAFPPGIDTEQLLLKFPAGSSAMVNFFIIAHLGGNSGGVYELRDWKVDGELTPSGGSATLSVRVKDHQNDVSQVLADTTIFTGGLSTFTKSGTDAEVWQKVISNTAGAPEGTYKILVMGTSPASPSYQTYNYFNVDVVSGGDLNPTVFGEDIGIENDTMYAYTDIVSAGHRGMAVKGNTFYLTFWSTDGSGESAIYFTKSTDGGATWSSAIAVTGEGDGYDQAYSNFAVGNGNLYIVYHTNESGVYEVKLAHSSDDGTSWTLHNVTASTTGSQDDSSVAVDINSSPEKVYVACVSSSGGDKIICAKAAGTNLDSWTVGDVSGANTEADSKYGPSITFNTVTNKAMVIWSDFSAVTGNGNRIYFDQSSNGTTWQTDMLISDDWATDDREWEGSLAFNPVTGVPGVLYRHYILSSGYIEVNFTKATSNTATAWQPTSKVSDQTTLIFGCSLMCDNDGRWVGAWFVDETLGWIFECAFDESLDDGATWGTDQLVNDARSSYVYNPTVASNGDGDVCVAWADGRSMAYEIYIDHGTN
jgi:hypothetical protein